MQTLVSEMVINFADDAAALIKGCGRIIVQFLMAPIERIATACDVAGVLPERGSAPRLKRVKTKRAWSRANAGMPNSSRSRRPWHLLSFRFLSDLT
jgi:hypothetical protein